MAVGIASQRSLPVPTGAAATDAMQNANPATVTETGTLTKSKVNIELRIPSVSATLADSADAEINNAVWRQPFFSRSFCHDHQTKLTNSAGRNTQTVIKNIEYKL